MAYPLRSPLTGGRGQCGNRRQVVTSMPLRLARGLAGRGPCGGPERGVVLDLPERARARCGLRRGAAGRQLALDTGGFWRPEIRHSVANPASCRVAVLGGFVEEARLARQHLHADGWHDVHFHSRLRATEP